jgi:hypothetical protein
VITGGPGRVRRVRRRHPGSAFTMPEGERIFRGVRPRLMIGLLLLGLVVIIVVSTNKQGVRYAAQVKAGYGVESSAYAAVPFQASCVTLVSIGAAASPPSKQFQADKLLYLGQSGVVIVLYQVGVGTVRIPSGSFALRPVSDRCRD